MIIEIRTDRTQGQALLESLFQSANPEYHKMIEVSDGLQLTFNKSTQLQGLSPEDFKTLIEISVSISSNIGIGLLTNYLYDKLKNKAEKIWINNKSIKQTGQIDEYKILLEEIINNHYD